MNEALKTELEQMLEADQAIRKEVWPVFQKHGRESPEYEAIAARGRAQDAKHIARLREIIAEHGWPGLSLVGEEAARGAFLVLQHADLDTQKELLPVLREATDAGESPSTALPLLEDRVRMLDGEDQIYGSQFFHDAEGKPALWPIENEAHVDERRAAVGLEPLAAYLERVGLGHLRPDS